MLLGDWNTTEGIQTAGYAGEHRKARQVVTTEQHHTWSLREERLPGNPLALAHTYSFPGTNHDLRKGIAIRALHLGMLVRLPGTVLRLELDRLGMDRLAVNWDVGRMGIED